MVGSVLAETGGDASKGPLAPPLKGRSGRLGFLGGWPFGCENLVFRGWKSLDFLGSPSESSLFNGLHGIFGEKILAPFGPKGAASAVWALRSGHAEGRIISWGELALLIFCKRLSPLSFPLSRLNSTYPNSRTGGGRRLDRRALGQEPRAFMKSRASRVAVSSKLLCLPIRKLRENSRA